jgi:pyruvate-ferredoxin/flavodoxin oxidoreductase
MSRLFQRAVAAGGRNAWDEPLAYLECESSHSAASACEGIALAGGRAVTFTSGQGLLEMAEILHSAAGKRLPMVFHVASRSVASQGLTIHAGHDDVMLVSDAGCGMLFARDAQECADLAAIARRAGELCETPFLVIQDGFVTTHAVESVRLPEPELLKIFNGNPSRRLRSVFDPQTPLVSGPVQNQDSYMKGRIAQRFFYERVRPSLLTAMADFHELTGRHYELLRCFRMEDAEYALVGLGSLMRTAEAAVEILRAKGIRAGAASVLCFRPFPSQELVTVISKCRSIAVVERTDTPLAESNPLTTEVKAALAGAQMGEDARLLRVPEVFSGAAGLGGSAITPGHLVASVENMQRHGRRFFVLGIKHADALPPVPEEAQATAFAVRWHSLAGHGATSAVRLVADILAKSFDLHVRAGSEHGAEERGSFMRAWISAASKPILAKCEPALVNLVVVDTLEALRRSDAVDGLQIGGSICVDTSMPVWNSLPVSVRRAIRERNLHVYTIDAQAIGGRRGLVLAGAILRIALWSSLSGCTGLSAPPHGAVDDISREFFDRGYAEVRHIELPDSLADYEPGVESAIDVDRANNEESLPCGFCDQVVGAYARGADAALEADLCAARSLVPAGSARFRSYRNLVPDIPKFTASNCTGCMECVNLCPDSAIVALVSEVEHVEHAPREIRSQFAFTQKYYEVPMKRGEPGGLFGLYIDADRCKGCGECVEVCGSRDALQMFPKSEVELANYDSVRDFLRSLPDTPARFITEKSLGDIMLSSRAWLHEGGAGSCPGCGGSSAIRMLLAATGMIYGRDGMGIVAAMGCHQADGTTYPYTPYDVAWANTLASNAPAGAMGIRTRWDQQGGQKRRLWVIGTEDALAGAGLHSLAAMIRSGMDINVLILDKTASAPCFDLGSMLMCHSSALIAKTTPASINHFYKCVVAANEYRGPAVVICYAACVEEHGIAEDRAAAEARLAVQSRAFPIYLYDPRAGKHVRERLDIRANPSLKSDWVLDPKSLEPVDFIAYARTQGRFAAHFNDRGAADTFLKRAQQDCLLNWRRLQELAGLR